MVITNMEEDMTGKILFVDDEPNILKSLQREFNDSNYEVYTAQSADEGQRVLRAEKVDIVVSDYKMPDMDGMDFLRIVMRQFPTVSRVMLSGFIDQQSAVKALSSGLASTYITKPWQADTVQREINHLFKLRQTLKKSNILKMVNSIQELPALPHVYREFVNAVETGSTYATLASIIMNDIAGTTTILRIANSAYYHLDSNISIERALSYIGIDATRQILLLASLSGGAKRNDSKRQDLQEISIHSLLTNYCMKELYNIRFRMNLPERFSFICITHDIGKVIMLKHMPDRYNAIIAHMKENPGSDFYASELALGFAGATHAHIGAYFLDLWALPRASIEAALSHHDLRDDDKDSPDVLEICMHADRVANYSVSSLDSAIEGLPELPGEYTESGEIHDLITNLKEAHRLLGQNWILC